MSIKAHQVQQSSTHCYDPPNTYYDKHLSEFWKQKFPTKYVFKSATVNEAFIRGTWCFMHNATKKLKFHQTNQ